MTEIALTEEELLAQVETDAKAMCVSLVAAIDGGVSQIKLMPMLIGILKEGGLLPEGKIPFPFGG